MSFRSKEAVTFDIEKVIQPIYTGGDIAIDSKGNLLATCLGDQVVITRIRDGHLLRRIEGVCSCRIENVLANILIAV